jgi:hypothetical protein
VLSVRHQKFSSPLLTTPLHRRATISPRNFESIEGATMYQGIHLYVTTGIALVGASAIAVTPIAVSPPDVQFAARPVAERVVAMSDVQLASLAEDSREVGRGAGQGTGNDGPNDWSGAYQSGA